jgi:hypothetical protein
VSEIARDRVAVTDTAKSKAFRMSSTEEVKNRVRDLDGDLVYNSEEDFYYLVYQKQYKTVVLALSVENGSVVVVTQMHDHDDFREKYPSVDEEKLKDELEASSK